MNTRPPLTSALADFCQNHGRPPESARAVTGDASARRYFRIAGPDGVEILVDASAEADSLGRFIQVAGILRRAGLAAPEIYHHDSVRGFMLLEDLGRDTLVDAIAKGADANLLYDHAVDVLIQLHQTDLAADCRALPRFDAARFRDQAMLYPEMLTHIGFAGPVDHDGYRKAIQSCLEPGLALPQNLLLRDFHGQNLIWRPGEAGLARVGLLDFQDAGWGPVSYDLLSLIEDARRDLPPELYKRACGRYLAARPELDTSAFESSMQVMAAMRHLRILAVFTRLSLSGKTGYLEHIPRVRRQLAGHLEAPCLAALKHWLNRHLVA